MKLSSGEVNFNPYLPDTTHFYYSDHDTHYLARKYDFTGSLTGQRSRQTLAPPTAWPTGRRDGWRTEEERRKNIELFVHTFKTRPRDFTSQINSIKAEHAKNTGDLFSLTAC